MSLEITVLRPQSAVKWRQWLSRHHQLAATVWVAVSKKGATKPTLSQSEAVDEALCYGWIDGTARSLDEHYYLQSFSRRKPKSVWSKINKEKIARFTKAGRMAQPGMDSIVAAKANGYWSILDRVEELVVPEDLVRELRRIPVAGRFFDGLSRSNKKPLLQWIVLAQRAETRAKRIAEIVAAATVGEKPERFGK